MMDNGCIHRLLCGHKTLDEVIVMPGDVQKNDLLTGSYDEKPQSNMRSFESVAKEDGKQLLCVYAI